MTLRRWSVLGAVLIVGLLAGWSVLGGDARSPRSADAPDEQPTAEKRPAAPSSQEKADVSKPETPADEASPEASARAAEDQEEKPDWKNLSEKQWRRRLTPKQYYVTRQKGTERAFTGKYWNTKTEGTYRCVGCGLELFSSDSKFDAHCGWPSFYEPINKEAVETAPDFTLNMRRTEVICPRCGAHLGHVFPDGPKPTGLRYCINSASLKLDAAKKKPADGKKPAGESKHP
jgi:peptide-methionine (R)-S-oxide reductase